MKMEAFFQCLYSQCMAAIAVSALAAMTYLGSFYCFYADGATVASVSAAVWMEVFIRG
jgi:hypothetical protein